MARKGIHPDYHDVDINIIHRDGKKETIKGKSTFNGSVLSSEVDLSKHVAWADTTKVDSSESINPAIQKFNLRFNSTIKSKK